MRLVILMTKKLLERFMKKIPNQTVEKVIKRKGDKLYVNWKDYDNLLNSSINKRYIVYMRNYFPKPKPLGENGNVELDLFNYAIKADVKKQQPLLIHQNLLKRLIKTKTD